MNRKIIPGARSGRIQAPSSKSQAHRQLICAALSEAASCISCPGISKDIEATVKCLNGLGARISYEGADIRVMPAVLREIPERTNGRSAQNISEGQVHLYCGESGSTLRFLLPVAGALGADAVFHMEGRLSERPMELYENVLKDHGMTIKREGNLLYCSGQLRPGVYSLPGNISSQYFTGLLFALPLLDEESVLMADGIMESADYVRMTEAALKASGIIWENIPGGYHIPGKQHYKVPEHIRVEGDYSNAAFFLCMGAMSPAGITVGNISEDSAQGDRRICDVLREFGAYVEREGDEVTVRKNVLKGITIDASMIPDLIPVLSTVAAVSEGETRVIHGERLRMKESDRIASTAAMLRSLGADITETQDGMIIHGKPYLKGGAETESFNDHRIAMAAASAACMCEEPVTVLGAECVAKSFPDFWEVYDSLQINKKDR
ncbi:MAG: 3-phosphoshikimate 1-carboxyvinyltransferase [Parasporobacterium sp.]|nr:3-phosphoshikimate 1-carboxyvinyltransferase [Parasporobacterium sp.]